MLSAGGVNTIISGTLNSPPNRSFFVDVYRNLSPDPSGYGEGQFYVGTANLTTDGSGNGAFTLTAAGNYAGQYFTATATSAGGDTSEFSANLLAVTGPSAQFTGPFQSGASGFTFGLTVADQFQLPHPGRHQSGRSHCVDRPDQFHRHPFAVLIYRPFGHQLSRALLPRRVTLTCLRQILPVVASA